MYETNDSTNGSNSHSVSSGSRIAVSIYRIAKYSAYYSYVFCGCSLGLVDGLLIMALTMSISGFIFGFGPWVFNQILAFGVLMALWSLIAPRLSLVWQIALVTLLSFLYGVLMDYSYGLLFRSGITFVISGLLYDTYHAVSTLLFYPFIQSIFRRFLK